MNIDTAKHPELAAAAQTTKNAVAFGGNVLCSVALVFANKVLMGKNGYGFHYATTLSALHFLFCGITVLLTQGGGRASGEPRGKLPLRDLIIFTAVADVSIITLNLSLLLNAVTTYQIAKLLVIPFVCMVEYFFLGSRFNLDTIVTIMMVIVGVAIVTIEEVSFEGTFLGLIIAAASVVASGLQQILVRYMQQKHKLTSNELLGYVAPAQAISLLLLGPPVDKLVSSTWVVNYNWNIPAINIIALSCALAIGVNVTQFLCLGRFSAVTFQVLGHSKTILVLLGSCLFLGEAVSSKRATGMALAVVGMVMYGRASMGSSRPARTAPLESSSGDSHQAGSGSDEEEKEGVEVTVVKGKANGGKSNKETDDEEK